jgi:hypothetical protein
MSSKPHASCGRGCDGSELAAESPEARRVVGSYAEALDRLGSWSRVSIGPFLAGRSPSS